MYRFPVFLSVCVGVFTAALSHADTIYMNNGQRIDGHIVSESDSSYTIETGSTTFEIATKMIDRVVKYTNRDTSLVSLGDELVSRQDYATARQYYERALDVTKSPEVIQKRLKTLDEMVLRKDELLPIDTAMKKGQYRLAADLCMAFVEHASPDDALTKDIRKKGAIACCKLAQQYFDSVRTEEAVFELRRAIELDPYNPTAHSLAGMILARTGKYSQALEELNLAQEIDPTDELAAEGLRILGETTGGQKELIASGANGRKSIDTRKLNELLGEAEFSGHTDGIMYAALSQREKPIRSVHFDMNAIARRSVLDGTNRIGGKPLYQFRSTRALSVFLQAYNAGPGAAAMYDGNVPYRETVNYVERVAKAIEDISSGKIGTTEYDPLIEKYAVQFGFHPTLIKAIVKVESDFNPKCVSTADARGLIQLVKVDWVDTMKRLDQQVDFDEFVFDPEMNLMVGCHYLRWLLDECLPKYFEEDFG